MNIRFNIHEKVIYRWVGLFEGVLSVLLSARFGWPAALAIFILIRFINTQLLDMLMNMLLRLAARSQGL